METKLERISKLSRENPDMVFTSVGHLINEEMLKQCHKELDGNKAEGIDNVSGTTGIAHTRWATHGAPAKVNSHPH